MNGWQGLLNLVFKHQCALCHEVADLPLCPSCQQKIQQHRRPQPAQLGRVLAWGTYRDELRTAIAALKYHNRPQLAELFGHWLGATWQAVPHQKNLPNQRSRPLVVPIPMNAEKRRERGFDQAELLARSFSHYAHLPYCARGLERVKQTEPLFNLNPSQRQQAIAGAFSLGKGLQRRGLQRRKSKRPILLVDDIFTTGTTAKAAAQVLRHHEFSVQGIVVLAAVAHKRKQTRQSKKTQPRRPTSDEH